jgi:hypothetical protein
MFREDYDGRMLPFDNEAAVIDAELSPPAAAPAGRRQWPI